MSKKEIELSPKHGVNPCIPICCWCGVKNLSRSDMDDLILYTEHFIEYGYFIGLRESLGSIAEVLKNADLKGENNDKN